MCANCMRTCICILYFSVHMCLCKFMVHVQMLDLFAVLNNLWSSYSVEGFA